MTNAVPAILGATTNLDGSFHLTGTLFNGITEGAAYGDDEQMNSDYPVARMTNAMPANTLYCRTYNWSTCNSDDRHQYSYHRDGPACRTARGNIPALCYR